MFSWSSCRDKWLRVGGNEFLAVLSLVLSAVVASGGGYSVPVLMLGIVVVFVLLLLLLMIDYVGSCLLLSSAWGGLWPAAGWLVGWLVGWWGLLASLYSTLLAG